MLTNRFDDVYFLKMIPGVLFCADQDGINKFITGENKYDIDDTTARNYGLGGQYTLGVDLIENAPKGIAIKNNQVWPRLYYWFTYGSSKWHQAWGYPFLMPDGGTRNAEKPGSLTPYPAVRIFGGRMKKEGYTNGVKGRYQADLWQAVKDNSVLARPGLKNWQPEFINRICNEAMSRALGKNVAFKPPYFLPTYSVLDVEYLPLDVGNQGARELRKRPFFTGALANNEAITALDPWAKMFENVEHQIYLYGEGDTVTPGSDGLYAWPFGLRMPIPPTVGNIYVHFLQLYLIEIVKALGSSALASPVMNSVDANVAFAVVYPEAFTSAQVLIGNYIEYAGNGITYAHPEGNYYAKFFAPDGTLNGKEVTDMARDVAAYANRMRQKWISNNQAIFAKAQTIVANGGNIYAVNISQLQTSNVVVTDNSGTVQSQTPSTEITGGSGTGNVVTQSPTTGQTLQNQNLTPQDTDPLKMKTVKVVSLVQNTYSGNASPVVSIARDTSPSLVSPIAAKPKADIIAASPVEITPDVTTPEKSSSVVPITVALALLSLFS